MSRVIRRSRRRPVRRLRKKGAGIRIYTRYIGWAYRERLAIGGRPQHNHYLNCRFSLYYSSPMLIRIVGKERHTGSLWCERASSWCAGQPTYFQFSFARQKVPHRKRRKKRGGGEWYVRPSSWRFTYGKALFFRCPEPRKHVQLNKIKTTEITKNTKNLIFCFPQKIIK